MLLKVSLPLHEPLLIFTVIISIVLLAPIILKKVNIPDIIGLIVAGVIIGPHGLNILSGEIGLSIFGTIGLLYLMFLAGLEVDLNDFFRRRREGTIFGILTFLLPFVPGFMVFFYVLDYRFETAMLVATMLASHTLVSYPILGRLGIINHRIVTITIAGTIIADTTVLIILGVISDSVQGDLSIMFWLRTVLYFTLFFVFVLKLLPMAAQWFFRRQPDGGGLHYLFVLTAIFISATIAELLRIEPLIGAFFCGLSLNRYIPRESELMKKVLFVGNTLFIPFFLISIGMMVNTEVLVNDPESWMIIGVLAMLAIGGKYLAAWGVQKFYKFSASSRNLIFGLSTARAASAIAIMLVGSEFNLVDDQLLNSTIFLILVTSVVSTVVTQRSGNRITKHIRVNNSISTESAERLMVAVGNPENITRLVNFTSLVKKPESNEPIFPVTILPKGKNVFTQHHESRKTLKHALEEVEHNNKDTELITRIDNNVIEGLGKAIKEFEIDRIIIGWNSATTTIERLFGSLLDNLLIKTNKMILVSKLTHDFNQTGNLQTFLPDNIQSEKGFQDLIEMLMQFSVNIKRRMLIYGNRKTLDALMQMNGDNHRDLIMVEAALDIPFFEKLSSGPLGDNDLLFFVKARKKTMAHSKIIDNYPKIINRYFDDHNLVMVYPEQIIIPKGIFQLYNLNN
jgi:Kef-type K+ transport system membrane component KefB